MSFRVVVLPQARGDIDRNADWWAEHHSVEQAVHWSDAIYDQIETLADFPESHPLSAENGAFPYEIRDRLVGLGSRPSYRAVFTVRDGTAYVLTVRRAEERPLTPDQVDPPPES